MNKMFSANQRKDKDMSTGQYNHPTQEGEPVSDTKNNGSLLFLAIAMLVVSILLVVFLL